MVGLHVWHFVMRTQCRLLIVVEVSGPHICTRLKKIEGQDQSEGNHVHFVSLLTSCSARLLLYVHGQVLCKDDLGLCTVTICMSVCRWPDLSKKALLNSSTLHI